MSDVFATNLMLTELLFFFPNFLYLWDDIDLDSCFLSFFNQFLNLVCVW